MDLLRDRLQRLRSETGATLVEVLVALSILSIAGVAIMAGLQLTVKSSDIHRKQSTSGAYVRSYAEAIEKYLSVDGHYVPCAAANAYNVADVEAVISSLPDDYTVSHSAAVALDGNGAEATGTCPSKDKGVQRLRLTVDASDGRGTENLTIVVRRACGTGTACP